MLVNRPEFHLVDTAALHLGATSFSIYNTSSPEQIAYLFGDAPNTIVVTERGFLDRIQEARADLPALEHVVVVDGDGREGTLTLDDLAARGEVDFDFEATWRAVEPDDVATLIYTSGTTGPPKGVAAHARQPDVRGPRRCSQVLPDERRPGDLVPAVRPHRRPPAEPLRLDRVRLQRHLLPRPAPDRRHMPDTRPTMWGGVPRVWEKLKAALEAGFQAEPDEKPRRGQVGARRRPRKVRAEQAGEPVPDELREEAAKRRRAGRVQGPRAHGPRPGRVPRRRRGAHAARGARVLRRARDPDLRGLGDVGDLGDRHPEPARRA